MESELATILKSYRMRLTPQRVRIFEVVTHHSPISNARLGDLLESELDRATVYRNVELFEKIGVIKRVWTGWKSQVELSERFVPHHHHAVCNVCGSEISVDSPELEAAVEQLAHSLNFSVETHTIELVGACSSCRR